MVSQVISLTIKLRTTKSNVWCSDCNCRGVDGLKAVLRIACKNKNSRILTVKVENNVSVLSEATGR